MAPTYIPIASTTLSTSAASVTFSAIPQTYTDLVVRLSVRNDQSTTINYLRMTLNSNTGSVYSNTVLRGDGSTVSSAADANVTFMLIGVVNSNSSTSNTFANGEIYIPSYTASQNKPISGFGVGENNATFARMQAAAGLFRSTTAVSSITIANEGGSFVSGSSFHLYGISNA